MTVIAGCVEKRSGKVWIGGDSAGTDDSGAMLQAIHTEPKVFTVPNRGASRMLIGFTTSWRMGQLLRYKLTLPEHPPDMDDHAYLCVRFADTARTLFRENGIVYRDHDRDYGGQFLIGYRSRLYCFQSDFAVSERAEGYDAVGCGQAFALGAMHASDLDGKARVMVGLRAAECFSAGVAGPFVVKSI